MDFTLDDNQRAIAGLAAEVLREECEPEQRGHDQRGESYQFGEDYQQRAWAALAKVGLLSLALPSDLGGDALGIGEVAILLTEAGRTATRLPALSTLALGVLPIVAHGTAEQRAALLPPVAEGGALLTGAPREAGASLEAAPRTRAEQSADDWLVTGVKAGVHYAEHARRVLVPAGTAKGSGVFLVDPNSEGVQLQRTPSSTGAPEYTMRLDGVRAEPLGDEPSESAVRTLHDLTLAGAAAVGDGALAGALDLTTVHLRTRHQFGKPLATFQAVAQQVADVYIASRTVHLAATSAVWRMSAGLDADEDLRLAAYWLAEEAPRALRTCHHLHGGLGVDETYPLHRHYSTLKDLTRLLGGSEARLEGLACISN